MFSLLHAQRSLESAEFLMKLLCARDLRAFVDFQHDASAWAYQGVVAYWNLVLFTKNFFSFAFREPRHRLQ
jgi:hypothetical protein